MIEVPTAMKTICRSMLLLGIVALAGCGPSKPPLPKTYAVTGKAFYRGGAPIPAGTLIEFRSPTDPNLAARGMVDQNGDFSLFTLTTSGDKANGAGEGEFEVTLIFPPPANEPDPAKAQMMPDPIKLPRRFVVEPKENQLSLEVPKPK